MARGRQAERPTDIPAQGWKDIALRVKDEMRTDHVGLVAAGVAFYALLAIFPALTALLAIGGLVFEPAQIVDELQTFTRMMPPRAGSIVLDQAREVAGTAGGGLRLTAVVGILLALFSASKGVGSLVEGMNVAYDERETRGFIRLKLATFGLTVALVAGLLVAMTLMAAVPAIVAEVAEQGVAPILTGASWLLMLILAMFALSFLYHFAPDRDRPQWTWTLPGSIVASIVWLIASIGFALYLTNFGTYNESFGSLAGVIALLMWLWISAFIVLMGAELNAEMEAQTRHDTTVGDAAPMGERGAVKADRLGERRG